MEEILSDNTYEKIDKDSIKKLICDLRSLLVRWKSKNFIDESTYRKLFTISSIRRAYGLTKIKQDNPLKIIVSVNSPLYYLSLYYL